MKQSFFFWYYGKGLRDFLEAEKNLLFFLWRYFSITDLTLTLFSPWKRDVVVRYWRGFQPLKSLERLIDNLISRFIGGLVRTVVIAAGLVVFGAALIFLFVLLLIWIIPLFLLAILFLPLTPPLVSQLLSLFFFLFYLYILLRLHSFSNKTSYSEMSLKEILSHTWASRIAARLGDPNLI